MLNLKVSKIGTIDLGRRPFLGGKGSKICQICRRIVLKNCRRQGGRGQKLVKICRRLKWMVPQSVCLANPKAMYHLYLKILYSPPPPICVFSKVITRHLSILKSSLRVSVCTAVCRKSSVTEISTLNKYFNQSHTCFELTCAVSGGNFCKRLDFSDSLAQTVVQKYHHVQARIFVLIFQIITLFDKQQGQFLWVSRYIWYSSISEYLLRFLRAGLVFNLQEISQDTLRTL